uniref:C2H2-type domain-containing protein n=1 Tax=Mastacembelus armatus TaxID=205130 RepID=A0A7N9ART6_9TELE
PAKRLFFKAGLTAHLRGHAMAPPFNCKTCKKGFWNKTLLRNHNRKCRFGLFSERNSGKEVEVPLKAEIDIALNDSVLVFKESSKTTGTGVLQTNFSCKDDSMDKSPQNSEEAEAQSSSSKEKKAVQYQCSECDMSFTDGLLLISHLEDHGREEQEKRRNTCIKCGRMFTSRSYLEKHMKNVHGTDDKYSCPDCSKVVHSLSDLEIHRTCHDLSRPYACKLCSQRFLSRMSLCISITGESDENENNSEDSDSDSAPYFPCHVCGKTFPTSESLEDHQLCHLGEKPHECEECGRCFFQSSQLQQHQRMHKSEFQCQACGRGFVSLFALRKHKHSHGKSRPYRCSNILKFLCLTQYCVLPPVMQFRFHLYFDPCYIFPKLLACVAITEHLLIIY